MAAIDKAARIAAEDAAKAAKEAEKTQRLDPPFPYKAIALDRRFLKLLSRTTAARD